MKYKPEVNGLRSTEIFGCPFHFIVLRHLPSLSCTRKRLFVEKCKLGAEMVIVSSAGLG